MAYIVRENDCGYMPDSDPAEFNTFREAKDYARELKEQWYEMQWDTPKSERYAVTVWAPLRKMRKSDTYGGVIYASLDTPIDRVIVITYKDWLD
jgi:hypothetical protein